MRQFPLTFAMNNHLSCPPNASLICMMILTSCSSQPNYPSSRSQMQSLLFRSTFSQFKINQMALNSNFISNSRCYHSFLSLGYLTLRTSVRTQEAMSSQYITTTTSYRPKPLRLPNKTAPYHFQEPYRQNIIQLNKHQRIKIPIYFSFVVPAAQQAQQSSAATKTALSSRLGNQPPSLIYTTIQPRATIQLFQRLEVQVAPRNASHIENGNDPFFSLLLQENSVHAE
ncbi:hypothetical protein QBC35DRAFT_294662 [Podospora australis]|uniref:Uncharacterized protein n=1 Tax=Podospora australis TaxID=1536484 RepID=A0AAN6X109_9PEZI|nr:hypothetical protein QBC35DRAFT_294662 [Podospora australis]